MRHFLLILYIGIYGIANSQQVNEIWLKEINKGKEFYKEGKFEIALKHFEKASSIVPFDTTAFVYIAHCGLKSGKTEKVDFGVEKLKLLKYNKPFLYEVQAANLRTYMKKYAEALAVIREGLNSYPGNIRILYEEILVYYESRNYDIALAKADKFIKRYPKHLNSSKLILNIVTEKINDHAKAESYFRRILPNFPANVELLQQEVNFFLRIGKLDLAKSHIEDMLKTSPNDPKLYYNLGLIHYYKNDYEKSIEMCHKAIQIDPDYIDAHFNIGIFFFLMGIEYNKALSKMNSGQFMNQGHEAVEKTRYYFKTATPHLEKVVSLRPEELDAIEAISTIAVLEKNLTAITTQIDAAKKPVIKTETSVEIEKKPNLSIEDLQFVYVSNNAQMLKKGEKAFVRFKVANRGNMDAIGLKAMVSTPLPIQGLVFKKETSIDLVKAGESKSFYIEVKYETNTFALRGIKKISDIPNKIRLFIKEPKGHNSIMQEVAFELDNKEKKQPEEEVNVANNDEQKENKPISKNYLFIIGVDNYMHWPKLNNSVKDSKELRNVLTTKYHFSNANIFELYNDEVTLQNIRNEFVKLKNEVQPNDNLIIYYSGHGKYDNEKGINSWIPFDANLSAGPSSEYIQTKLFFRFLEKLDVKHAVIISDACFSNSLFNNEAMVYRKNRDEYPSRWAFSSGNYKAKDENDKLDIQFASTLINTLSTSDTNISISELIKKVKYGVEKSNDLTPIGRPLKTQKHKEGDYIFYLK